ncbi:MAG: pseudouridine synthase [Bacteroidota bacterium]
MQKGSSRKKDFSPKDMSNSFDKREKRGGDKPRSSAGKGAGKSFGDRRPAGGDRPASGRPARPFKRDESGDNDRPSRSGDRKPFREGAADRKPFGERGAGDRANTRKPYEKKEGGDRSSFRSKRDGDAPREEGSVKGRSEGKSSYRGGSDDRKPPRATGDRPYSKRSDDGKAAGRKFEGGEKRTSFRDRDNDRPESREGGERPYKKREDSAARPARKFDDRGEKKTSYKDRSDDRATGSEGGERPYKKREEGDARPARKFEDRGEKKTSYGDRTSDRTKDGDTARPYKKREDGDARPPRKFEERGERKTSYKDRTDDGGGDKPERSADTRPFRKRGDEAAKPAGKGYEGRGERKFDKPAGEKRPYKKREGAGADSPFKKRKFDAAPVRGERKHTDDDTEHEDGERRTSRAPSFVKDIDDGVEEKKFTKKAFKTTKKKETEEADFHQPEAEDVMPLNKYIAHSGECSRRDAAEFVKQGKVKVNGELVLDPGHKIGQDDKVTIGGKKLVPQKGMVYILLNKPKGYITTNEDPQGRRTVMELVASSGVDRLFAVGRLDRNTTGLLLITNDGDLTQKLSHPAYNIKKVYQVTLDKPLTKADFEKIIAGVTLDDGIAQVDELAYLESKNELGLEIHSGRNRIVRRIFESLGYEVEKLDRMMYAGLTKKNLPRSKWRFLDEREIVLLKHFKS